MPPIEEKAIFQHEIHQLWYMLCTAHCSACDHAYFLKSDLATFRSSFAPQPQPNLHQSSLPKSEQGQPALQQKTLLKMLRPLSAMALIARTPFHLSRLCQSSRPSQSPGGMLQAVTAVIRVLLLLLLLLLLCQGGSRQAASLLQPQHLQMALAPTRTQPTSHHRMGPASAVMFLSPCLRQLPLQRHPLSCLQLRMGQLSVRMADPLLRQAPLGRHPLVAGIQPLQPSNLLPEMGCTPRQQGSPHPTPLSPSLQMLQVPLQSIQVGSVRWVPTRWGDHQMQTRPIKFPLPMGSAGVRPTMALQKRNAQLCLQLPSSPPLQTAPGPCQEESRGAGPPQRGKAGKAAGGVQMGMRLRRTPGRSARSSGSLPWCRACSGCG